MGQTPRARPVNLFVIGAMKSGTTSLHRCLQTHPDIFMSALKEPNFFKRPNPSRRRRRTYRRLFRDAKQERFLGESSTSYSKMPLFGGVPERIHSYNPDAKLIYLVRDPFERTVSHYRHMVRVHMEAQSFGPWLANHPHVLSFSHYSYQLRPYLRLFGPEAVFVGTMESFVSAPEESFTRLFDWLGIDASSVPERLQRHHRSPSTLRLVDTSRPIGAMMSRLARAPVGRKLYPAFPPKWLARALPGTDVVVESAEFQDEAESVREVTAELLSAFVGELEELTSTSYHDWRSRADAPPAATSELFQDARDRLRERFGASRR